MKRLIYVAGPISKGDIVENVMNAHEAGLALLRAGYAVIVPHGSVFWGNQMRDEAFAAEAFPGGTTHAAWMGCDLEIVRRCDCLLRLPGESAGADLEEATARRHGLPVYLSVSEAVRALAAA